MEENSLLEELKASLDLSIEVGRATKDALEENKRVWNRMQFNTPILYRKAVSGVASAAGFVYLNVGSPDNGTYWDVENCAVGGVDYNVAAAGSAGLYVVGMQNNVSPGMGFLEDYAATLPNTAFYGFRDIVINDGESLIVIVNSGTSGQTYMASLDISVYNVASGMGRTTNIAGM